MEPHVFLKEPRIIFAEKGIDVHKARLLLDAKSNSQNSGENIHP